MPSHDMIVTTRAVVIAYTYIIEEGILYGRTLWNRFAFSYFYLQHILCIHTIRDDLFVRHTVYNTHFLCTSEDDRRKKRVKLNTFSIATMSEIEH